MTKTSPHTGYIAPTQFIVDCDCTETFPFDTFWYRLFFLTIYDIKQKLNWNKCTVVNICYKQAKFREASVGFNIQKENPALEHVMN